MSEQITGEPVRMGYTNYRGEFSVRTIIPRGIWFGTTEWHPEPQWFLKAYDCDKAAERDFALRDLGVAPDRTQFLSDLATRGHKIALADMERYYEGRAG